MTTPQRQAPRAQWFPVVLAAVCASALAALLFVGVQRAARLQSASSALQIAAGLAYSPELARSELTLVQRGLETRTFVGDSLRAIASGRRASEQAFAQLARAMQAAGVARGSASEALRASAATHWQTLEQGLASLDREAQQELYLDSATGSELAPAGQQLKRTVDMLLVAQAGNAVQLGTELAQLSAQLRQNVVAAGATLRGLLLGGAALASLLLATMLYFALRAARAGRAAARAEQQVSDMLATVREGLFLVGRDGRIGGTHSHSLRHLLRTETPGGRSFESLLRPLVDERTLQAATRFLGLLWKDKVNEDLIETVNPLSPIAVNFARPGGGTEQRHLSFGFRRIRGSGSERDYLFGVVNDVTDRIALERELERLKAEGEERTTQLLHMLQVEPLQLQGFLGNVDATVRRCNALLRVPGHEQQELQQKVQGVFREMHALKGEASALGLGTFARRAHAIEEQLEALRASTTLAGNDFVPLVVRLGELLTHGQELANLRERVVQAHSQAASAGDLPPEKHGDTSVIAARVARAVIAAGPALDATLPELDSSVLPAREASRLLASVETPAALATLLQQLAREVGAACGRAVHLRAEGLDMVPATHAGRIREICVQMVRNAIVHGIEPAAERMRAGKPSEGNLRVRFSDAGDDEYSLQFEDDGRGLDLAAIRDHALERGLIDPGQAATLERTDAYRLLFQAGFSTASEVSEHAGRGVGLDVVNAAVRALGGRIGIASVPGRFTRFKLALPRTIPDGVDQVSAA